MNFIRSCELVDAIDDPMSASGTKLNKLERRVETFAMLRLKYNDKTKHKEPFISIKRSGENYHKEKGNIKIKTIRQREITEIISLNLVHRIFVHAMSESLIEYYIYPN